MAAAFEPIAGPFGGTDERATTNAFVEYVGGTDKADRLQYLWNQSYPNPPMFGCKGATKEQVFRRKAREEGFKKHHIDAFLMV